MGSRILGTTVGEDFRTAIGIPPSVTRTRQMISTVVLEGVRARKFWI